MTEPEDHELILPESGGWSTRADGLRMRFWRRGDRIVSEHAIPETYHGPSGMAHGGIVATLFDEISCEAADLPEGVLALLDHHLLDLAGRPTAIRTRAITFHPLSWASSR